MPGQCSRAKAGKSSIDIPQVVPGQHPPQEIVVQGWLRGHAPRCTGRLASPGSRGYRNVSI
jgi:hypothetical protein